MPTKRLPLFASIILAAFCSAAEPGRSAGPRYVSVAFHDVVDQPGEYTVTTGDLVSFFEWLRGHGWTAITLDDIARAKSGTRPLPERAILISFDDGYRSLYTRVYPLLMAYRIPVVASLICSVLDGPAGGQLLAQPEGAESGMQLQRSNFISWAEAREMAGSGLVEFASHTYDLHRDEVANPLGGRFAAAAARRWSESDGYETEEAFRKRIRADLERSRSAMKRELGISPRALAWPYGRSTRVGEEEALAAHFEFLLTLDPYPGAPEDLPGIPRVLASGHQNVAVTVTNVLLGRQLQATTRLVRFDPAVLPWQDPAALEKALGVAVERVRSLGVNRVIVDAGVRGPSGSLEAVWFPSRLLPVKADLLSRIVWQLRTRAGVVVAVSLPVDAARGALTNDASVERLYQDLGASVPADAVLLEHVPALAGIRVEDSLPEPAWNIRRRRNEMDLSRLPPPDALAMRCFFSFERERPGSRLYLLAESPGPTPSAVADLTLIEAPAAAKPFRELVDRLRTAGWLAVPFRDRSGVWIRDGQPPSAAALSSAVRLFQRRGGVAFGWEPDDPFADLPRAAAAAPAVSTVAAPRK